MKDKIKKITIEGCHTFEKSLNATIDKVNEIVDILNSSELTEKIKEEGWTAPVHPGQTSKWIEMNKNKRITIKYRIEDAILFLKNLSLIKDDNIKIENVINMLNNILKEDKENCFIEESTEIKESEWEEMKKGIVYEYNGPPVRQIHKLENDCGNFIYTYKQSPTTREVKD